MSNRTAKKSYLKLKVNNFLIEQSENIEYQGMVLGDELNWKAHLKYL